MGRLSGQSDRSAYPALYIESDSALCRYRSIDDRGADATDKAPHTHKIEIVEQGLLVEPGSFVLDIQKQGHISKTGGIGLYQ